MISFEETLFLMTNLVNGIILWIPIIGVFALVLRLFKKKESFLHILYVSGITALVITIINTSVSRLSFPLVYLFALVGIVAFSIMVCGPKLFLDYKWKDSIMIGTVWFVGVVLIVAVLLIGFSLLFPVSS